MAAVWLHDIGYAPASTPWTQPATSTLGWPRRLTGLVAHHSGALFVACELGTRPRSRRLSARTLPGQRRLDLRRKAGPSPVDRAKQGQGLKRSTCTDTKGIPLGIASAGANRHDSKLLDPTLHAARQQAGDLPQSARVHLDSACNGTLCQAVLAAHQLIGEIAA